MTYFCHRVLDVVFINARRFDQAERVFKEETTVYESLQADLSDNQLLSIADTQAEVFANYILEDF